MRDIITASMSSTTTTFTVTDIDATTGPRYHVGGLVEIDYETMIVTGVNTGTNVATVIRGYNGSTPATHVVSSPILFDPHFHSVEILDLLNDGLDTMWPRFYQEVVDESLTADGDSYEFTIPEVSGLDTRPIPRIHGIEIRPGGFTDWVPNRRFEVIRGSTPKLKLLLLLAAGTDIRILGYAPLPHLTITDTSHEQLPYHADNLAVDWAVGSLLYSGEAGRVRFDVGPIDRREQATATGSSMRVAREWERRFYQRLGEQSMPPMLAHKTVSM